VRRAWKWPAAKPGRAKGRKIICALSFALALGACSDSGSDVAKLERRLDELARELRQARSEAQRGHERVIAALQEHFTQGTGFSAPSSPSGADAAVDRVRGMETSRALQAAQVAMSERMSGVPLTGDPDRDFLAQMIPHHEGAIDMSKVLLTDGVRPEVRRLAQEIIAHQQAEIEMMKRWLAAVSR
jgi:uncharacterized protein (DUF305 family)